MPMKISLALGPRQRLSPQTALGCLTSNLAMPGAGSLMAGRVSGYAQFAVGVAGLILTTVFGVRFIGWYVQHWSSFFGPEADSIGMLPEMWRHVRWALLGIAVFGVGWLWSLGTGLLLVREAKAEKAAPPPLK
jgi:hypothetical protein